MFVPLLLPESNHLCTPTNDRSICATNNTSLLATKHLTAQRTTNAPVVSTPRDEQTAVEWILRFLTYRAHYMPLGVDAGVSDCIIDPPVWTGTPLVTRNVSSWQPRRMYCVWNTVSRVFIICSLLRSTLLFPAVRMPDWNCLLHVYEAQMCPLSPLLTTPLHSSGFGICHSFLPMLDLFPDLAAVTVALALARRPRRARGLRAAPTLAAVPVTAPGKSPPGSDRLRQKSVFTLAHIPVLLIARTFLHFASKFLTFFLFFFCILVDVERF